MEMVWIPDDKYRSKRFDQKLSTGTSQEWMEMIKLIYLKKQNRISGEKTISPRDNLIMKEAKRLLHEEFAVALEIEPEEVEKFITSYIRNRGRLVI